MASSSAASGPQTAPGDEVRPGGGLGILANTLGFRLRRLHTLLIKSIGRTISATPGLEQADLRPGTLAALALIAANPGISQTELASLGGYDKTAVMTMVDVLEDKDWAVRRRSPTDRRRHVLGVTPEGERMLRELDRIAIQNEARINAALTEEERRQLYEILDRIYDVCARAEPE